MMDVPHVAVYLTHLLTLGLSFVFFLAHVLMLTTMLMLAGAARLAALTFAAPYDRLRNPRPVMLRTYASFFPTGAFRILLLCMETVRQEPCETMPQVMRST